MNKIENTNNSNIHTEINGNNYPPHHIINNTLQTTSNEILTEFLNILNHKNDKKITNNIIVC